MPLSPAQEEKILESLTIAFLTDQASKHPQSSELQAIALKMMTSLLLQLLAMPSDEIAQRVKPYYRELTGKEPAPGMFDPPAPNMH